MKIRCADERIAKIVADGLPTISSDSSVVVINQSSEVNIARAMLKEPTDPNNQILAFIAFGLEMMPTISLINAMIDSKRNIPLLLGVGGSLGDINNPKPLDVLLEICMRVHTFESTLTKLPPMEATR